MFLMKVSLSTGKVSEHSLSAAVYHSEDIRSWCTHWGHLNYSTSALLLFKALMRNFIVQKLWVYVYFHKELQILWRLIKHSAKSKCPNIVDQESKVVLEPWCIELITIVNSLRVVNMECRHLDSWIRILKFLLNLFELIFVKAADCNVETLLG
jgi:hypothetical protein